MNLASILSSPCRKLAFMNYGERLQQALTRAKKDRNALAVALKVSVQAVGQVITGGRSGAQMFNAENSAKAAQFLEVDPVWLATGEGEMVRPAPATPIEPLALLSPEELQARLLEHLESVRKLAEALVPIYQATHKEDEQRAENGPGSSIKAKSTISGELEEHGQRNRVSAGKK